MIATAALSSILETLDEKMFEEFFPVVTNRKAIAARGAPLRPILLTIIARGKTYEIPLVSIILLIGPSEGHLGPRRKAQAAIGKNSVERFSYKDDENGWETMQLLKKAN
jgi:hypothetical protein